MIIVLNQNDLFKQLQSEKFVIGKSLFKATQILIEKTSLRMLKEISEHQYKKLEYNFKVLKDKWKKLRGGLKRSKFIEENLKQNLILTINEVDFEVESLNSSETSCEFQNNIVEHIDQTTGFTMESQLTPKKSWKKANIKRRRRMRAKIQRTLSETNNFLKEFGLCFKKIELADSSLFTYNNRFEVRRDFVNKK